MTFIAGVITPDAVYISGDRRGLGGGFTFDNITKVNEIVQDKNRFAYAAWGKGGLLCRLQALVEKEVRKVGRGDTLDFAGPEDLIRRVVNQDSVTSVHGYEGSILVGGYSQSGKGLICSAGSSSGFTIICQDKQSCPVYAWPTGIQATEEWEKEWRQKQDEIWCGAGGDANAFLTAMSAWIAERDPGNSCSTEVDIVRITPSPT